MINIASRRCVATLWTLAAAKKEAEYFKEYVGMDLGKFDPKKKSVIAKKVKDGVWDVVANVKKFNREVFAEAMKNI